MVWYRARSNYLIKWRQISLKRQAFYWNCTWDLFGQLALNRRYSEKNKYVSFRLFRLVTALLEFFLGDYIRPRLFLDGSLPTGRNKVKFSNSRGFIFEYYGDLIVRICWEFCAQNLFQKKYACNKLQYNVDIKWA